MTHDEMPPVMRELVKLLPPPGANWPVEERARWLHAFSAACRLVFKDDVDLRITVAGQKS
jgi:hypothetical protein